MHAAAPLSTYTLPITRVAPSAYTVPCDAPEADGTFAWRDTTLVLVELTAGDVQGLGYTYADPAAADVVAHTLAPELLGQDALDIPARMAALQRRVRNLGRGGLVAMALSAVDVALWDVKARALGEMRVMEGNPKYEASQSLPDFPYAQYAESLGLRGIKVDRPEQLGAAWEAALSADRPVVLEACTDPDVPPLPPHITLEQAKAFASSVLEGDPDRGGFIKEAVKDMVESVLPHGGKKG